MIRAWTWLAALGVLSVPACSCGDGVRATTDTGAADAIDTGSVDTGSVDTGSVDTGSVDTGSAAPDAASDDAGSTVYSSWTECGWSDPSCTCAGVRACAAVAGGAFEPLGSSQARVCAIDGGDCVIVTFDETEGGGVARRCRIPLSALACSDGIVATSGGTCEELYTCNVLMGNCPSDIALGSSVIHCP